MQDRGLGSKDRLLVEDKRATAFPPVERPCKSFFFSFTSLFRMSRENARMYTRLCLEWLHREGGRGGSDLRPLTSHFSSPRRPPSPKKSVHSAVPTRLPSPHFLPLSLSPLLSPSISIHLCIPHLDTMPSKISSETQYPQ